MFLNLNKAGRILMAVGMACALSCLWSCSDNTPEPPQTQEGSALRFGISGSHTRATHNVNGDFNSASFEDGDEFGAIIYEYYTNEWSKKVLALSKWHYHKGILILDKIFIKNENVWPQVWEEKDLLENGVLSPLSIEPAEVNKGFLKLKKDNQVYRFAFWYPYFDADRIESEYKRARESGKYNEIIYPYSTLFIPLQTEDWDEWWINANKHRLIMSVPVSENDENNDWNYPNNWTNYPCFVNITQQSEEQTDYSNFMWSECLADPETNKDISNDNPEVMHTINLEFVRKMAAIDLIVDDPSITDPYYKSQFDTGKNIESGKGVTQGVKISLFNGKITPYGHQAWNGSDGFSGNAQIYADLTQDKFLPYLLTDNKNGTRRWRLLLPPQNGFNGKLHVSRSGSDYTVDIDKVLKELEENTLYVIRLKQGRWTIEINDWEYEADFELEEIKKTKS